MAHNKIERLGSEYVRDVWRINQLAPEAAPWSLGAYENLLATAAKGWVALADSSVVGFAVTRLAADEMEILNFAVLPEHRRQGFGKRLLETAVRENRREGAARAYLEVRASNSAAIAFYKANGFKLFGRRPSYYADPVEDAVVMERKLES
ncbi:MAG: ribosomal protein S18-alanine N-acetyltransferase [Candidatus Acidiferrales bacterium]